MKVKVICIFSIITCFNDSHLMSVLLVKNIKCGNTVTLYDIVSEFPKDIFNECWTHFCAEVLMKESVEKSRT